MIQAVPFSSPSWRTRFTPWKGHLTIPKRSLWITRLGILSIHPVASAKWKSIVHLLDQKKTCCDALPATMYFSRWWFQHIFLFSPLYLREMIQFWLIFFKLGWNHQLDDVWSSCDILSEPFWWFSHHWVGWYFRFVPRVSWNEASEWKPLKIRPKRAPKGSRIVFQASIFRWCLL